MLSLRAINVIIIITLVITAGLLGVDRYVTPHAVQHVASGPDPVGVGCTDAVGTDTYACTLSPAITSYTTGACYTFKAGTANTGAASINFNALGAKTIVKVAGGVTTALADNDIRVGSVVSLCYDGTNMQMQSILGNAPAAGGSGALILLESCTASASASCDFDATITSTYDTYVVYFINVIPATDDASLLLRFSTDGGSTYVSAAEYSWINSPQNGSVISSQGALGATSITVAQSIDTGVSASWSMNGHLEIHHPGSSIFKAVTYQGSHMIATARHLLDGGGFWESTSAANAFQFLMSSGNIASGTIRVYGVTKP